MISTLNNESHGTTDYIKELVRTLIETVINFKPVAALTGKEKLKRNNLYAKFIKSSLKPLFYNCYLT